MSHRALYEKFLDRDRCLELQDYFRHMQYRAKADHALELGFPPTSMECTYGPDEAVPMSPLSRKVMYFQPVLGTPCDRREVAKCIVGRDDSVISQEDKVLNVMLTYMYGPTWTYLYLTGKTDPKQAFVDFDRVYSDPTYVNELRENIAYARSHGHSMWTTTELHTSIQTEGRNYVRKKYNEPDRKAHALDIVEWMASFKHTGVTEKIIKAKTLKDAYEALTSVRGIGPYFGWNSIVMIANCRFVDYTHDEPFVAPGGGAIATVDYLFEPMLVAGHKVRHADALVWMRENQKKFFPYLYIVEVFQNVDVDYGKLLKHDQTEYTTNSFEVGCCQFNVYRKFQKEPEAMKRRLNPPSLDLEPFKARERGEPMPPSKSAKPTTETTIDTKTNLLSFD